jgi:hypothetical protein
MLYEACCPSSNKCFISPDLPFAESVGVAAVGLDLLSVVDTCKRIFCSSNVCPGQRAPSDVCIEAICVLTLLYCTEWIILQGRLGDTCLSPTES